MNTRDAARDYIARGFAPIPIPASSKAPVMSDWPNLKVTDNDVDSLFEADANVGLLLGAPSAGLIDIDLDAPQAVELAPAFLPPTELIHGRAGNPLSHWWYRAMSELATKRFQDIDGASLVEVRSTGAQTVVPPSTHHPSGESIEWAQCGTPTTLPAEELMDAASALAAATLVVRHYPKPGARQDFAMALSGALLRAGWPESKTCDFVLNVAGAAGDEEADKRADTVARTAQKLAQDGKATGFPTVAALIGEEVARKLTEWLKLRSEPRTGPSGPSGPSGGRGGAGRPDRLRQLFEIVSDVELFHSRECDGYATVALPTGPETLKIESQAFTNWLCGKALRTLDYFPRDQVLKEFTHQLAGRALHDCPSHDVHLRVAGHPAHILIDLADAGRHVAEVTAAGWRVVEHCPTRFYRPIGMQPIPIPMPWRDLGLFREFFNYDSEDDFRLMIAWLAFALSPKGPYPVLVLGGEAGSAKSTTARMLREIVDPNSLPLRSFPRNEHDLMIAGRSSHILCFDNLSGLTELQSDMLCRVATGGGFGARRLYSDSDEARFNMCRPPIVNGIDDLATRPDLIDRAVVLALPRIPPERRCFESTLLQNFERARPHLLGALLGILVEAVRQLPSVKLTHAPRMADFARSSAAAEQAIGWPVGGFNQALDDNQRAALQTGVESSVVAYAVYTLMTNVPEWTGTATELLERLNDLSTSGRPPPGWPRTASQLGSELRRVAPALRAHGISVGTSKSRDKHRTRLIHLSRTEHFAERGRPEDGNGTSRPFQFRFDGGTADATDAPDATDAASDSLQ